MSNSSDLAGNSLNSFYPLPSFFVDNSQPKTVCCICVGWIIADSRDCIRSSFSPKGVLDLIADIPTAKKQARLMLD